MFLTYFLYSSIELFKTYFQLENLVVFKFLKQYLAHILIEASFGVGQSCCGRWLRFWSWRQSCSSRPRLKCAGPRQRETVTERGVTGSQSRRDRATVTEQGMNDRQSVTEWLFDSHWVESDSQSITEWQTDSHRAGSDRRFRLRLYFALWQGRDCTGGLLQTWEVRGRKG